MFQCIEKRVAVQCNVHVATPDPHLHAEQAAADYKFPLQHRMTTILVLVWALKTSYSAQGNKPARVGGFLPILAD
jgi:hypothetical protein